MAYQPIENYGIVGDLNTIALAGMHGSIDYMCFPDFDSPTIFGALLDHEKGGRFSIAPAKGGAREKQLYLPDTNVLLTRFLSDDGVGEITDFMPVGSLRYGPTLVRRVTGVRGPFTFDLECSPRFDYARQAHHVEQENGEVVFTPVGNGHPPVRLRSTVPVEVVDGDVRARFTLGPDETADFVFELAEPDSPTSAADYVDRSFAATIDHWRGWLRRSSYSGRWRDAVGRSALALKLLANERHGSIAAAGTFGLPEEIGGERNWDYRYTWIRDASLTAASLVRLGFSDEPADFMRWVERRFDEAEEPGKLQIMYGLDGRHDLSEQVLDHLSGYRGAAPVRIGNGAYDQLQLDIYGELLFAVDLYDLEVEPVSYDFWTDLSAAADWVSRHWRDSDEGIWEVRGGAREFLYSRLTDWVALDRAIRIAQRRSLPAPLERWLAVRDEIHDEIYHGFWSPEKKAFVQYKGSTTLDASTLLMPLVGFIAPRDPRWLSTLDAVGQELVDDALVYRYRPDEAASDGLEGAEGTFCMCSYWYIECLARAGEVDKARLGFEKMHGYANHLGLYAEEMDPTGRYLGNFPQAFTHLGLVNAALCLDDAIERRR